MENTQYKGVDDRLDNVVRDAYKPTILQKGISCLTGLALLASALMPGTLYATEPTNDDYGSKVEQMRAESKERMKKLKTPKIITGIQKTSRQGRSAIPSYTIPPGTFNEGELERSYSGNLQGHSRRRKGNGLLIALGVGLVYLLTRDGDDHDGDSRSGGATFGSGGPGQQ